MGATGEQQRETRLPPVTTSNGREPYRGSPAPDAGQAEFPFMDSPGFTPGGRNPRLPATPIVDAMRGIRERERQRAAPSADSTPAADSAQLANGRPPADGPKATTADSVSATAISQVHDNARLMTHD
jgi:hypothetical protein